VLTLTLLQWIDLVAVAVFAISGALAAADSEQDVLGFVLFATITGVGGGTLRDILLNADPVFWIAETRYLWICLLAALATWFVAPLLLSVQRLLIWMDAVGLALFSVLGAAKALSYGVPAIVAVGLGTMSATFGSLIRDTLLNRPAVLLGPEIYVTAALTGALVYTLCVQIEVLAEVAFYIALTAGFALRAAAIVFDLRFPKYQRNLADSD